MSDPTLHLKRDELRPEVRSYVDNLKEQVLLLLKQLNVKDTAEFERLAAEKKASVQDVQKMKDLLMQFATAARTGEFPGELLIENEILAGELWEHAIHDARSILDLHVRAGTYLDLLPYTRRMWKRDPGRGASEAHDLLKEIETLLVVTVPSSEKFPKLSHNFVEELAIVGRIEDALNYARKLEDEFHHARALLAIVKQSSDPAEQTRLLQMAEAAIAGVDRNRQQRAYLLFAQAQIALGRFTDARETIEKNLTGPGTHLEGMSALARAEYAAKQDPLPTLEQAHTYFIENNTYLLQEDTCLLATTYAKSGQDEKALEILKKRSMDIDAFDWNDALCSIIRARLQKGKPLEAFALLNDLRKDTSVATETETRYDKTRAQVARALAEQGLWEQAEKAVQGMELDPERVREYAELAASAARAGCDVQKYRAEIDRFLAVATILDEQVAANIALMIFEKTAHHDAAAAEAALNQIIAVLSDIDPDAIVDLLTITERIAMFAEVGEQAVRLGLDSNSVYEAARAALPDSTEIEDELTSDRTQSHLLAIIARSEACAAEIAISRTPL